MVLRESTGVSTSIVDKAVFQELVAFDFAVSKSKPPASRLSFALATLTDDKATFTNNSLLLLDLKNNCVAVFSPSDVFPCTNLLSAIKLASEIGFENLATKN